LTGFTIGASGSDMEIRGMVNPAALAEYIRRLKTEPVFRAQFYLAVDTRPVEAEKALEAMLRPRPSPAQHAVGAKEVPPSLSILSSSPLPRTRSRRRQ
jgi:hypothetical protein